MQPQNKILIRPLNHTHTHIYAYSQPQTHAKVLFLQAHEQQPQPQQQQRSRRFRCCVGVRVCLCVWLVAELMHSTEKFKAEQISRSLSAIMIMASGHTNIQSRKYMYIRVCVCVWDCAWVACLHTYPYYYRCVCNYLHPIRAFSLCIYLHVHMYVCTYLHVCMCTYPHWYLWII